MDTSAAAIAAPTTRARWLFLILLLGGEALLLSLLVDLPQEGPALGVAAAIRVLFPVAMSALVAYGLAARLAPRPGPGEELPPWRPLPWLALHAGAFAATAAWSVRLLGHGAPAPGLWPFAAWVALGAGAVALGVASAVPLPWLGRNVLPRWRAPALALGVGVLTWIGAWCTEYVWGVFSLATVRAAGMLLGWLTDAALVVPAERVLGLPGFEIVVAPSCSGAEGVGLVLTFLGIWMALRRDRLRLPRALLLLAAALLATFGLNAVRVAALVVVGAAGHPEVALGGFHSKLGWFLFTGIALGGVALAEHLPWLQRPARPAAAPEPASGRPVIEGVELLLPLLATLAVALATELVAPGEVDLLYGARVLAALTALAAVRGQLPSLRPARPAVAALVGLGVGAAWIALSGGRAPEPAALGALAPGWRVGWIALRALGGVAVIPLVEELAFRGVLLDWLTRPAGGQGRPAWRWAALLVSSLAFGSLHARFLLGAAAGAAFGAVRLWRGRVGDAALAHAVANAAIAAAVLLDGRWGLWS
jgi:exosortase E/protease (VPEID-CTERM system)